MYEYNYADIDGSDLYLDGVGPSALPMIVDDLLADCSTDRRRELLLDPALLGAAMELHLTPSDTVEGHRVVLMEVDGCLWKIRQPEDFLRLFDGDAVLERLRDYADAALLARLPDRRLSRPVQG